jgi:L-tartrate/succinate antiporter
MWTSFAAMCVTSSMFLTALAPNLLAQAMLKDVARVPVTWVEWFVGFLPVGLVLFALTPLLVYWIYPPTLRASAEVPQWARTELERLGRIKRSEVVMALLVTVALALWILGSRWVSPTTTALLVFCLMLLTGIVAWDDVLGARQAWNALVWFATLVTLADGLNRVGFLGWFAAGTVGTLAPLPVLARMVGIVLAFFVAHYMFASLTAPRDPAPARVPRRGLRHPGVAGATAGPAALLRDRAHGRAHALRHRARPIFFGSGYITRGVFWTLGTAFGAFFLLVFLLLDVPWLIHLAQR